MAPTKKIREFKVSNSMTGKKEVLETQQPGKLTMYSCGPTVYSFIHIGNLRAALTPDLFFRCFKRAGYDVTYVRNYTDVDDRIIKRAQDEGTTSEAISKKYIQEVEKDYALAGLLEPTRKTTVTDHMAEIIQMIQEIIANGKGYVAPDGEVLFSVQDFPGYGKLAGKNIEELLESAGARVEVSSKKRNPLDFTLWKPAKPGEPEWDSPWGKGRPGWHIECSAMATKWLGPQLDLHHGGEDLVFPHHENEIAQSEAATGKAPYVKYWLHNAFLTMKKEKMSKSLGNVLTAREFLAKFGGEFTRFLFLSVHYRTLMDFSDEALEHAWDGLHRIYEAKQKAQDLCKKRAAVPDMRAENAWGEFVAECEKVRQEIDEQYANDFNTPGALGSLFTLIRAFNRTLSEPMAQATPTAVLGATELIRVLEEDIGSVFGVGRSDPAKMLKELERIKLEIRGGDASGRPSDDEIRAAIQARADARKAKNFAEADRIRKDLEARGVVLKDGAGGTTWEFK